MHSRAPVSRTPGIPVLFHSRIPGNENAVIPGEKAGMSHGQFSLNRTTDRDRSAFKGLFAAFGQLAA